MSKLDDIFDDMNLKFRLSSNSDGFQKAALDAKQQIKDLMLELIGEGQVLRDDDLDADGWREYKKKQLSIRDLAESDLLFREELRQKVNEL